MKMITGLIEMTSGEILFHGERIQSLHGNGHGAGCRSIGREVVGCFARG
jgi:ABC-type sugar transport system ATPase subunit